MSTNETTTGAASQSVISTFTGAVSSLVSLSAEGLAKVVGLWTAARAAVSTVASGVAAAATQSTINTANAKYQGVPLSPATLATAIVRNVLPDSTGAAGTPPTGYPKPLYSGVSGNTPTQEAELSGVNGNRFAAMVGATGESYGVVDALRMLNRNVNLWSLNQKNTASALPLYEGGTDLGTQYGITSDEFAEVVAHSDIRPEYIPDLLKLARNTISAADAVEMAVKQVIGPTTGQNLYAAAGGIPEQYQALVDAAGDSMGPQEIVNLLAHGKITFAQAELALGMSRVNPRFYYAYLDSTTQGPGPIHDKWLSPFEYEALLKADPTQADNVLTWMEADGYDSTQAKAWVNSLVPTLVAKVKDDTASQVLKLYAAQVYTEAETTTALSNLGYSSAAIEVLEQQALATQMLAQHNSAVSRVRAAYLVGEITSAQVGADLGELGVPAAAVSAFLTDWDVEIATPKLHLSAAQVGKLTEEGYLSAEQAQAKWIAMGYSGNDAALLLIIYPPANAEPPGAGVPAVTG